MRLRKCPRCELNYIQEDEDYCKVYLTQDGIGLDMEIRRSVDQKMAEIVSRDPKGTWDNRGLDLLDQAETELEQENK